MTRLRVLLQPTQLTADGRLAGLTRDGTTSVATGGLVRDVTTGPVRTARRLRLEVKKHGGSLPLARASGTLRRAGTARLVLRSSPAAARAVARARRLMLHLAATSTHAGARPRTIHRTLTLRRARPRRHPNGIVVGLPAADSPSQAQGPDGDQDSVIAPARGARRRGGRLRHTDPDWKGTR